MINLLKGRNIKNTRDFQNNIIFTQSAKILSKMPTVIFGTRLRHNLVYLIVLKIISVIVSLYYC